jgi:hypothetical protein
MSTSRAISAKGLVPPTRPAGQGWWLIWYVVNACRRPGRPHPASRRYSQATSDTMSERTLCHRSGQVVRTLKRPGPRHWTNGLSPPSLVAVHRRVTAPSLGSALLACGPCSGDVSRSCSSGMGFAIATNNRVTERHCTASVEVKDRLTILPPKTREEHLPWHQDTRRDTMAEHNAVVGIYTTHTEAEAAVKALQQGRFNMQKLSIVGKDYQMAPTPRLQRHHPAAAPHYKPCHH